MPRRAELAAYLLVVIVGAGLASSGAATLAGLLATCLGVGVAWLLAATSAPTPRDLTAVVVGTAVGAAVIGWLLVSGIARGGVSPDSLRVPLLVLVAVLTVGCVRRLTTPDRELLLAGVVLLGVLHAVVTLGQASGLLPGGDLPLRAGSLLDHPNALGIVLVATGLLTVRLLRRAPGNGWSVALAGVLTVQVAALLLSGSRLALLVAAVAVVVGVRRHPRLVVPAVVFLVAAASVVAVRSSSIPPQRPRLWAEAVRQIAERPWFGWGPQPRLLTVDLSWAATDDADPQRAAAAGVRPRPGRPDPRRRCPCLVAVASTRQRTAGSRRRRSVSRWRVWGTSPCGFRRWPCCWGCCSGAGWRTGPRRGRSAPEGQERDVRASGGSRRPGVRPGAAALRWVATSSWRQGQRNGHPRRRARDRKRTRLWP